VKVYIQAVIGLAASAMMWVAGFEMLGNEERMNGQLNKATPWKNDRAQVSPPASCCFYVYWEGKVLFCMYLLLYIKKKGSFFPQASANSLKAFSVHSLHSDFFQHRHAFIPPSSACMHPLPSFSTCMHPIPSPLEVTVVHCDRKCRTSLHCSFRTRSRQIALFGFARSCVCTDPFAVPSAMRVRFFVFVCFVL
jgi:hypothetical protein